ncbi:acyl-CoA dehydrogenase family protein [Chloroflexota bacterium]
MTNNSISSWQVFTEPNAGSDEANIQLRATADGDDFIFNGQKMFVGSWFKPDFLYVLARTKDTVPKHRGLTLFLLPGDLPGIRYKSLPIMGNHRTNEVFFDDVRVSREYMLGELNRGFYHAMSVLEFERANTGWQAECQRQFEEFVQFCKEEKRNGKLLIEVPQVRDTLAKIAVELEVWRLAGWRTTWRFDQRERLGPLDYDLAGFYWKTFQGTHSEAMMNIIGLYGQLRTGSKWEKLRGAIERRWQNKRSLHFGGTIEIYKVVLAERGLGLPRRR